MFESAAQEEFTVTWTKSADRDLGELWIASTDRSGASAASFKIDQILRDDPDRKGNEVAEGLRAINLLTLTVSVFGAIGRSDRRNCAGA